MIDDAKEQNDFRLMIRPVAEQKQFKRWYTILNILHILLPDEMVKALIHPDWNVRKIKQYGYFGIFRHHFIN